MARFNTTGRSKIEARHVRLYHWMLGTPAWRSLDGTARAIYIDIVARYAGPGSNNGRIRYSVRNAAQSLRIGKSTAARALERLQDRGFIIARKKGAFSLKLQHATEWRLTEFQCDVTRALATKEFMRWAPENQNTVSPQTRTVPITGANDSHNGTDISKNGSHGTYKETATSLPRRSSVPGMGH